MARIAAAAVKKKPNSVKAALNIKRSATIYKAAVPKLTKRFMGKELAQLELRMGVYEKAIVKAAKLGTLADVNAWLAVVSDDAKIGKMQRAVRKLVKESEAFMRQWTKTNMPKAYNSGVVLSKKMLKQSGLKLGKIARTNLHGSATNFAIEQMVGDMATGVGSISQKLNGAYRKTHVVNVARQTIENVANEAVANRFVKGTSSRDVEKRMFNNLRKSFTNSKGELKLVRVIGPSGKPRNYTLKNYTRMVARTRTREAQVQGTKNAMIELGQDFVQISDHATESEICKPYEGMIYSISGSGELNNPLFDGALDGETEPPYHPNCLHNIGPYIPEDDEVIVDPTGTYGGES